MPFCLEPLGPTPPEKLTHWQQVCNLTRNRFTQAKLLLLLLSRIFRSILDKRTTPPPPPPALKPTLDVFVDSHHLDLQNRQKFISVVFKYSGPQCHHSSRRLPLLERNLHRRPPQLQQNPQILTSCLEFISPCQSLSNKHSHEENRFRNDTLCSLISVREVT